MIVELIAVKDSGVMGEGRVHFVFPNKPDKTRALANITGGIWIKKGVTIPEKIIITLKGVEE